MPSLKQHTEKRTRFDKAFLGPADAVDSAYLSDRAWHRGRPSVPEEVIHAEIKAGRMAPAEDESPEPVKAPARKRKPKAAPEVVTDETPAEAAPEVTEETPTEAPADASN